MLMLPALQAFEPAECAAIVALADTAPEREARLLGAARDHNIRRARLAWLDEAAGGGWVMERLIALVREANREVFGFDLTEFAESPQVATYAAREGGHFDWHADLGDGPLARRRKLTVVVQLSDPADYDGGALQVMHGPTPESAACRQGVAAVFPAFTLHRVAPVTRGVRRSLTVWAHGPAFR